MTNRILGSASLLLLMHVSTPILAAHANPWATDEDTVNAQFHDVNQARSIDTPGEDEMNGVMTRNAFGKLGGADRAANSADQGGGGGNGGHGGGGNGHGGGNGGGHGRD